MQEELQKIFSFLNLELSEEGYDFFANIKRSFNGSLDLFEEFIGHYLTIQKNGEISTELYEDFVVFFDDMLEIQGEMSLLEQFARYAKYFLVLNYEYTESPEIGEIISLINKQNLRCAYPFLMELLDDYENSRIGEDAFISLSEHIYEMAQRLNETDIARFSLMVNQMLASPEEQRKAG